MEKGLEKLHELQDRYTRLSLSDTGMWTNQNLSYARALGDMLKLAEVILHGGLLREESRGSHFRTDFPDRNDERFLKTTVATWNADSGRPDFTYEDVSTDLVEPRARTYGKVEDDAKSEKATA